MSKLKVSELFYSIQGEGKYMGVPSIFLRTFGCNFKCDGFGLPKGELSTERFNVQPERYESYKSLPLVSTGCDSYASWDPRFKDLSPVLTSESIVNSIMEMLPHNRWVDEHLVITGGEPLLGWQKSYPDLLDNYQLANLKELTFETNGTQMLTEEFYSYLRMWQFNGDNKFREVTFSVSPKLSVSGESWDEAIRPEVISQYQEVGTVYLKFVVSTLDDVEEAEKAVNEYRDKGFSGHVYLMPVGGVEGVYSLNNRNVAELALKKGWRYSDRLQVPLFKNEWGT